MILHLNHLILVPGVTKAFLSCNAPSLNINATGVCVSVYVCVFMCVCGYSTWK